MYQHTPMMTIVKSVLNIGVIVVFLMSSKWLNSAENRIKMGEFHTVVLFTLLGMYFMISSGHFIMFFIGLELASIPMAASSLRQEEPGKRRSWRQVHPSRPLLKRPLALWHLAHLRRDWNTLFR